MTQPKIVRMLTPLLLILVLFLVTGCHVGSHGKKSTSPNSASATLSNAAFTLNAFARSASQATTPIASERKHASLKQYVPMLKNQIAPILHLTTDHLKTRVAQKPNGLDTLLTQ